MTKLGESRKRQSSEGRSKATKSEGDDLEESADRVLMHLGPEGEDVVGEVKGVDGWERGEREMFITELIVGGLYY